MYAPSNFYGNMIMLQTVVILELQHNVRIDISFDTIAIINSLEKHQRPINDDSV
jgi:hypothetical protein